MIQQQLFIKQSGNLHLCSFRPDLGNINLNTLGQVWQEGRVRPAINEMNKFKKRLKILKYRYDIFLRPLALNHQIRLACFKIFSRLPGKISLDTLEIGTTYNCQLDCQHCGIYGQKHPESYELSLEEIKKIVTAASRLGAYLVVLSGGEPLLRNDIVALVSYITKNGIIAGISTNGQAMSGNLARELKKSRLSFLNISLDSANAASHDSFRGKTSCFDKAKAAILTCIDEKIAVIISMCLTKESIKNAQVDKIISLAKEWGASGVRLMLPVPAGKWLGREDVTLSNKEREYVASLLDPSYVFIEGVCNKFSECPAAYRRLLYISAYGDVQPCSFVPLSFGNIREKDLSEIWLRVMKHSLYQEVEKSDCIMRHSSFYNNHIAPLRNKIGYLPVRI